VYRDAHIFSGPEYAAAAERYLERVKGYQALAENKHSLGAAGGDEVEVAKYMLLEAQQWLEEAKSGAAP
jgi:hypothetical protein